MTGPLWGTDGRASSAGVKPCSSILCRLSIWTREELFIIREVGIVLLVIGLVVKGRAQTRRIYVGHSLILSSWKRANSVDVRIFIRALDCLLDASFAAFVRSSEDFFHLFRSSQPFVDPLRLPDSPPGCPLIQASAESHDAVRGWGLVRTKFDKIFSAVDALVTMLP